MMTLHRNRSLGKSLFGNDRIGQNFDEHPEMYERRKSWDGSHAFHAVMFCSELAEERLWCFQLSVFLD